jgi:CBS domain-containing protein
MMQAMMESMFGGSVPTLRKIIGDEHFVWVKPSSNVREASKIMATARKGVLVMEDDELVGILTPKDVLSRVLAKGKSPDLTAVSSVMTPNPDCVSADLTLLDALKEMHDHKYLHLPVRDEEGNVLGLVDVMELMCSTAGGDTGSGKGWRDFFQDAFDARKDDDKSETASQYSLQSSKLKSSKAPLPKKYEDNCSDVFPIGGSGSQSTYNFDSSEFVFKVDDSKGNTHRIKCISDLFSKLKTEVAEKLGLDNDEFIIKYIDEENDVITMSSDSSLSDAVEYARTANKSSLKLTISVVNHNSTPKKQSKENIVSYLMTPFKKYNPTDHISESDFMRKKMMVTSGITFFTASVITGLIIYLRKK